MTKASIQNAFEEEVFFSLRQQRNNWARMAIVSIVIAALSIVCLIIMLPLNETKPFVVMVDKTTGEAEKIVEVRPATLDQQDAVLQAELVSYISDRETYDRSDNKRRIPTVMGRSEGDASETLANIWNSGNAQYPPTVYGPEVRVSVVVKSISVAPHIRGAEYDVARVRITKVREELGVPPITKSFEVTLGYKFVPDEEATLEAVWQNPLGFTVVSYRIDAETGGGGTIVPVETKNRPS